MLLHLDVFDHAIQGLPKRTEQQIQYDSIPEVGVIDDVQPAARNPVGKITFDMNSMEVLAERVTTVPVEPAQHPWMRAGIEHRTSTLGFNGERPHSSVATRAIPRHRTRCTPAMGRESSRVRRLQCVVPSHQRRDGTARFADASVVPLARISGFSRNGLPIHCRSRGNAARRGSPAGAALFSRQFNDTRSD